jgi:LPPG:FO 2-phospho-L-lactate transferase
MIVLLSGGTGGAKLARGLLDVVGEDRLAVIANTGDDIAAFGLHVSPDPDLVTYWLAGVIDEQRGFGIAGETFKTFEQVVQLGAPDWFRLGDRDLATCLLRTELLHEGKRLTEIARYLSAAFGVGAAVLPMCDEPVQTYVRTDGEWRHFQEYLIKQRSEPQLEGVEFRGAGEARPTDEVRRALEAAETVLIGPSNPVASIGPILALPGMTDALRSLSVPVVAVSPLVGGRSLKGPTEQFMRWAGLDVNDAGIVRQYAGLINGLVVDRGTPSGRASLSGVVVHQTNTLMTDAEGRARLAREILGFAQALSVDG